MAECRVVACYAGKVVSNVDVEKAQSFGSFKILWKKILKMFSAIQLKLKLWHKDVEDLSGISALTKELDTVVKKLEKIKSGYMEFYDNLMTLVRVYRRLEIKVKEFIREVLSFSKLISRFAENMIKGDLETAMVDLLALKLDSEELDEKVTNIEVAYNEVDQIIGTLTDDVTTSRDKAKQDKERVEAFFPFRALYSGPKTLREEAKSDQMKAMTVAGIAGGIASSVFFPIAIPVTLILRCGFKTLMQDLLKAGCAMNAVRESVKNNEDKVIGIKNELGNLQQDLLEICDTESVQVTEDILEILEKLATSAYKLTGKCKDYLQQV